MARKAVRTDIKDLVFNRLDNILAKPRTCAHTPVMLAEITYALLNLVYEDRRYERYMNDEYPGSKPWYFEDGLEYPMAVNRLQKLLIRLNDEG
jgi:hypothetical protein